MARSRPKKQHSGTRRRFRGGLQRRKDTRKQAKMTRWLHFSSRLYDRYGISLTIPEVEALEDGLDLQWDGETHIQIQGQLVKVGFRDGTLSTALPDGARRR